LDNEFTLKQAYLNSDKNGTITHTGLLTIDPYPVYAGVLTAGSVIGYPPDGIPTADFFPDEPSFFTKCV
jgi:hypothetical protein